MKIFPRMSIVCAVLALCTPALADDPPLPACTCQNLESLQQDYQNAVYMEAAYRKLSEELRRYEAADQKKGTSRSETDRFGDKFYGDVVKIIKGEMPFPKVKGLSGPDSVAMPPGTCEQVSGMLDAMEKGSVCIGMADAAQLHEFEHRELCKKLGADVYWSRLSSEFAAEEADRYKIQAANLKLELRKVLEEAQVKLRGQWRLKVGGNGMEMNYLFENSSGDIGAASAGDTWTMTGTGETINSIESMKLPGTKCKSSGAIHNQLDFVMTTDGLTFSLEVQERSSKGDLSVKCGGGLAMSMPASSLGGGTIATGLALVAGDNPLPASYLDPVKQAMTTGGMQVSGEPETVLSVICPAP